MAPSPADLVAYSIRIVSCLILILGTGTLALGLWTIYTGGPIDDFVNADTNVATDIDTVGNKAWNGKTFGESNITIRVLGGLLITAGCVLIFNFTLGMFASFRLMAVCCIPSFLAFAMICCIIFTACGIAAITILEPSLEAALYAVFESNLLKAYGDGKLEGPLFKAQSEFSCCGPKTCDKYQEDAHEFYIFLIKHCGDTCYTMPNCVDALMKSDVWNYREAFAIGCFGMAGITAIMFIFSIVLCCINP